MIRLLLALVLAADPGAETESRAFLEGTIDGYGGSAGTGGVELGLGFRGKHLGFRGFVGIGAVSGDGGRLGGLAATLGTGGRGARFELDLGAGLQRFTRDEAPGDLDSTMMMLGMPVTTREVTGSTATIPFAQLRAGGAWRLGERSLWFRLGLFARAMERRQVDYVEETCTWVIWVGSCEEAAKTIRYGATSVGIYASLGPSRVLESSAPGPSAPGN